MVHTRARVASDIRMSRASALFARSLAALGARRSARLAVARSRVVRSDRLARFNMKFAKYSFCQLIGLKTPLACLERVLGLARRNVDIVAADPGLRAGLHQAVRVVRLLEPSSVGRVNRRWRAVTAGVRGSEAYCY